MTERKKVVLFAWQSTTLSQVEKTMRRFPLSDLPKLVASQTEELSSQAGIGKDLVCGAVVFRVHEVVDLNEDRVINLRCHGVVPSGHP